MTSVPADSTSEARRSSKRWPTTLWLGILIIAGCEGLLFIDVQISHRGAVRSAAERWAVANPTSSFAHLARWVAVNMTALVWVGYLFLLEGILAVKGASPVRRRPHHLSSAASPRFFIWGVFDMINFNLDMRAWIYIGMPGTPGTPGDFFDRACGYLLAFGTIVPGMLLSGHGSGGIQSLQLGPDQTRRLSHAALGTIGFPDHRRGNGRLGRRGPHARD